MNYEFFYFGFLPLYTLVNLVIFVSIYKKWLKEDIIINAYPNWKNTLKPKLLVAFRLIFILGSYFTPWIFNSSTRAFLINLFIYLPIHILVDQVINNHLIRKAKNKKIL